MVEQSPQILASEEKTHLHHQLCELSHRGTRFITVCSYVSLSLAAEVYYGVQLFEFGRRGLLRWTAL